MRAAMERPTTGLVRWRLPFVLLVSVMIAYFDRLNLSTVLPYIARDYHWSTMQTGSYGGTLFTIFFLGYGIANIFFSPLGERFGVKKSLMTAILFFSVFTVLTAPLSYTLAAFIAVRFLLGLGEGIHFPMMNTLIKPWFPLRERSRANGIWVSGVFFGTVLAPLIIIPVTDTFGWRGMFYILGALSLCITIPLIWFFIYNTPAEHPTITKEEQLYIADGLERDEPETDSRLGPVLRKKEFWIALLAGIFNNFCSYGLILWLPTFFIKGRGLPFNDLAFTTSLPYAIGIVGVAFMSWLGDKTQKRVVMAGVGFVLAGVFTYFTAIAPTIPLIVILLSIAVFFATSYSAQEFAIVQRILPRQSVATGAGLYNGLTTMIGGGLGSAIVGTVISLTSSYTAGLLTIVVFALLAGSTTLVLGIFLRY